MGRDGSNDTRDTPEAPAQMLQAAGLLVPPLTHLGCTSSWAGVWAFPVTAAELMGWWHRLREVHHITGLWPVLLGPQVGELFSALSAGEQRSYDDTAELAKAAHLTRGDLRRIRGDRSPDPALFERAGQPDPEPVAGTAAAADPQFDTTQRDGLVGLVPATHGWQVPGVLGWLGGLNYGVEPAEHVTVLRDWSQRFGAELVALTEEQLMELLGTRPPDTGGEQALEVAREQYDYCEDIVTQGVGSVSALAAQYVHLSAWVFWWD